MPKNARKKTKSELNKQLFSYRLLFIVACVLFLVFFLSFVLVFNLGGSSKIDERASKTCLQIKEKCLKLEVADTPDEQLKGLSYRDNLSEDAGMLFVFERPEEQCFWMKDMQFNLDIIWTDAEKRIIKIKEDVSPKTYPDSFCAKDSSYVLEFNSGFSKRYGLKTGTTLQFDI